MKSKKLSLFHICIFVLIIASFFTGCSRASASGKTTGKTTKSAAKTATEPEKSNSKKPDSKKSGSKKSASKESGSKESSDSKQSESQKSDSEKKEKKRKSIEKFALPEASGTVVRENEVLSLDASNIAEGYFMIQYFGGADKAKMLVTTPNGTQYMYTLLPGGTYETFPLSGGNGLYQVEVLEHAYDDMYATAFTQDMDVVLNDEFKPFLYPNQYAWYTQESEATNYALQLSLQSSDDLNFVENVYHYVIENISYDRELAATVPSGYIPDIDETMRTKKGICFDYASLMASMLRSQGIPTKLEVGYSGTAYHAWIDVYLTESGWIDKIIEFDGKSWSLMDPTLAAGNNRSSVGEYIGNGSNYTVKYSY